MIELKGSLETATLEKIVKKSCGYWISPDVEVGKLNDTVTAGSMVVMILDECAECEDVYDEYEDGYMDVSAGFLLPPLRRVLQCQSASSQKGNRSGAGHKRWSRRMRKGLTSRERPRHFTCGESDRVTIMILSQRKGQE